MIIQNINSHISQPAGYSPAEPASLPSRLAPPGTSAPEAVPPHAVQAVSGERIEQAADMINKAIRSFARDLHFSVDAGSGETIVRIVDTSTGDVIRQVPSEEVLAIAKALDLLQGLLIRQRA